MIRPLHPHASPPGATTAARPRPVDAPRHVDVAEVSEEAPPTRTSMKVLAVLGLAVATAVLAGCTGQPPSNGGQPGTSQPAPERPDEAAQPLDVRLTRLKREDVQGYKRLVEANLYRRTLERIQPGEGLEAMHRAAARGLELFRTEGDPAQVRDGLREILTEIARTPEARGRAADHKAMASSVLRMGDAVARSTVNPSPGLIDRLKSGGYEKALQQLLTLPEELASRGLVDAGEARAYVARYADTAEAALQAGREVKDASLQAPLYEETLKQLYERSEHDGTEIARQLRQILDVALRLKDGFLGR